MKPKIEKKHFIELIEALGKQADHDARCNEAFAVILPNDLSPTGYDNHYLTNAIMKVLQEATGDTNAHSWIEYYCYDLDFGRKYKDGCATDKDGLSIPLNTPEDLWNLVNDTDSN